MSHTLKINLTIPAYVGKAKNPKLKIFISCYFQEKIWNVNPSMVFP